MTDNVLGLMCALMLIISFFFIFLMMDDHISINKTICSLGIFIPLFIILFMMLWYIFVTVEGV